MTDAQADRMIALLEAIAKRIGARVPTGKTWTLEQMTESSRSNLELARAMNTREFEQHNPEDPLPPSGGMPPEQFHKRAAREARAGRSVARRDRQP